MNKVFTLIFGHPDLNKAWLWLRGFLLALLASSLGALLYLLNQWASDTPIDWPLVKQIFAYNVVPTVALWFGGLKAWLSSQSNIAVEELNKMLAIAIQMPQGATPEDVKAIYQHTENEQ